MKREGSLSGVEGRGRKESRLTPPRFTSLSLLEVDTESPEMSDKLKSFYSRQNALIDALVPP